MTLRTRLARLERDTPRPCSACGSDPAAPPPQITYSRMTQAEAAAEDARLAAAPRPQPCPRCRRPPSIDIVEVVFVAPAGAETR